MAVPEIDKENLVKAIVERNYSRQTTDIEAVGSGKNNFVYRVSLSLSEPLSKNTSSSLKYGTQTLPPDTTEVILRLSDPEANLNEAVRIQNEVAAIHLMRKALALYPLTIIPEIYGWEGVDEAALPVEDKLKIISQIAEIFKAMQTFQLPDTLKQIGGLGFNGEGDIISGPFTIPMGGPFSTHSELFKVNFDLQLQAAEKNAIVGGWRKVSDDNLYDRLQKFMKSSQVDDILEKAEKSANLTLIHGDFDIHNMLIDPDTLQITALLDFDFSHVSFAAEEFLYSFLFIHGLLVGPIEDDEYIALLKRNCRGFKRIPRLPKVKGTKSKGK